MRCKNLTFNDEGTARPGSLLSLRILLVPQAQAGANVRSLQVALL